MVKLTIDAGKDTESLLRFITNSLDDETLDSVEVSRDVEKSDNLATEPTTALAVLIFARPLIPHIARIIERWLEKQRQLEHLRIIAAGFSQSDECGQALADVSKAHAKVSVEYKLTMAPPNHTNFSPRLG